jgi:broad specificity phosphatase PhoE
MDCISAILGPSNRSWTAPPSAGEVASTQLHDREPPSREMGVAITKCKDRHEGASASDDPFARAASTMTDIVFETHSTSEDNERGLASGWAHSRLSPTGREQASAVGARRRNDSIDLCVASDLRRAAETAEIALADTGICVLLDWRLRECDYGERTREAADAHRRERAQFLEVPYPGGESWRSASDRVIAATRNIVARWPTSRVLVIGHMATYWGLERCGGASLAELLGEEFAWREGWEYRFNSDTLRKR